MSLTRTRAKVVARTSARRTARDATTRAPVEVRATYEETFMNGVNTLDFLNSDAPMRKRRKLGSGHSTTVEDDVKTDSTAALLFKRFPNEIHTLIAENLTNDDDFCNYILICKQTSLALGGSSWRRRFEDNYDGIPNYSYAREAKQGFPTLSAAYRTRQCALNSPTIFDRRSINAMNLSSKFQEPLQRQKAAQDDCLEIFKILILQSDAQVVVKNGKMTVQGKNLTKLINHVSNEGQDNFIDIIDSILNTDHNFHPTKIVSADQDNTLIFVVQLALTPLSLLPNICDASVSHIDLSQGQVYATTHAQPVFTGKWKHYINVHWLLHTVNFFKFHFKSGGEGVMAHAYKDLPADQYPQFWTGRVKAGTQQLGQFWKGSHTFMGDRDLRRLRRDNGMAGAIYSDEIENNDAFQDINLFFDEAKFPSHQWPDDWERLLQSDTFLAVSGPKARSTRSSPRKKTQEPDRPQIKSFFGISRDSKKAFIYGRIHALPQQQKVHGFQRIVMQRFGLRNDVDIDFNQAYCYEGCVFPGGTIMAGRWWPSIEDPSRSETPTGPFLWWNVNASAQGLPPDTRAIDNLLRFAEQMSNN
ncbi:hypothetical protein BJ875DRAFT_524071 [Amylocarpus encephaloides]|uniref:Uncharacterized protein n=1 Tax=Amylocarpus encephaloides TaxID=45428 RepID=A0A9P7Y875_9HELO|nr:hypothetical protein BJ875DRAFT_524071 [Amylocarpus encephaloides]